MRATGREGDSTWEITKGSVCSMSCCVREQGLHGALRGAECLIGVTLNSWLWERGAQPGPVSMQAWGLLAGMCPRGRALPRPPCSHSPSSCISGTSAEPTALGWAFSPVPVPLQGDCCSWRNHLGVSQAGMGSQRCAVEAGGVQGLGEQCRC